MTAVQYTRRNDIDTLKWDQLVATSPNGFVYSRSFFLDALCNWDALILGDYEYVMPLPWKIKAGFKYIYTPFFAGQLGITGIEIPSAVLCNRFIEAIPSSFSFIDMQLNEYNEISDRSGIQQNERTNFVVPLHMPFEKIAGNFNKDARKNIRQAEGYGLHPTVDVEPELVFELYKNAYGHLNKKITDRDYNNFLIACKKALAIGAGFISGVKDKAGNVVAAAFFAKDHKRIYYLLGAPSPEGKKLNATHFLINEVIRQNAGTDMLFDFEGSDIPSVAAFYKKFGPQKNIYRHIIINRLPFWIRWIKNR